MLIGTKYNWRDAIFFETESGGGAVTDNASDTAAATGVTPTAAELVAELERTKAALKAANSEAQQRRLKLDAIEKADKEREEKELSEAQKANKRMQEAEDAYKALEAKHRTSAINSAVKVAAMAAGFADSDDAVKLADLSGVQVGDDEVVVGAKEAVAKLATAKPHLLAPTRLNAPNINATGGGAPRSLTVEDLKQQRRDTDTIYQPF